MRFLIACFLLLCLLAPTAAADYTLGEHPRILINKAMLPELARRATAGGILSGDYEAMKNEADRMVATESARELFNTWRRPMDMLGACLVYLVERELGNDSAHVYARAVRNIWENESRKLGGPGYLLSNLGPGHFGIFALCYDWIHDYLTPEERKTYGDRLGTWLRFYTYGQQGIDYVGITLLWGDWLYNQTWGPEHLNVHNTRDGIVPKLFVALALSGAGTIHEADCRAFLDDWYTKIPRDCMPLFDMMGGVWSESMGHGIYANVQTTPWAFEAWRTATGMDWFQLGSETTFLKEMWRWAVHLNVPFNNRTAYLDDNTNPGLFEASMRNVAAIMGARYRDPVANRVAMDYDRGTNPENWFSINCLFRFVPFDVSVPALTPGQAGWPLSHLFEGAGHIHMRSRWDDPNATWAFFGAGPQYAGHSRDDEGHFLIAKKGWIVLRSGGQGHNDDDYYAGGSMPFNLVTVYDPNEVVRRDSSTASGGVNNPNDGGLIRRVYTSRTSSGGQRQERGNIAAYKHDLRYTYAAADLREGYSKSKLTEITRQFLYLRGEKEYFVIFDRVESTNAAFPKTWLLHMPDRPVLDGVETVLVADHVMSYSGTEAATWLSDPANTTHAVYSAGRARAFLKTLLPSDAKITLRGGTGHDFWGNPHNPEGRRNFTGKSTGLLPFVPWRLEVEPSAPRTRDYFLHVIEVTEEGQTAMTPVELLDNVPQGLGLRISPPGAQPVEVYLNSTGALGGGVRFGTGGLEEFPGTVDNSQSSGPRHDVDGDGRVGVKDALALILKLFRSPNDPELDFNGDGVVNVADVVALVRYMRDSGGPGRVPVLAGEEISSR